MEKDGKQLKKSERKVEKLGQLEKVQVSIKNKPKNISNIKFNLNYLNYLKYSNTLAYKLRRSGNLYKIDGM